MPPQGQSPETKRSGICITMEQTPAKLGPPVLLHDVVTDIFLKMPYKPVCKQWNVMFTNSKFMNKDTLPGSNHARLSVYRTHSVYSKTEEGLRKIGERWTERLSSQPNAFMFHNFLSNEECEYLIKVSKPYMERSKVFDETSKKGKEISSFTSSETSHERGGDIIISNIEKRIADYTSIPNGEGLRVMRYKVGQKIGPHYDTLNNEPNPKFGSRIATLLMYLSDVEEGGETVFPNAKGDFSSNNVPWWSFTNRALVVKPKLGDALLYWSVGPNGISDPTSFHEGLPVIRGKKWASTCVMHTVEYITEYEDEIPIVCDDDTPSKMDHPKITDGHQHDNLDEQFALNRYKDCFLSEQQLG